MNKYVAKYIARCMECQRVMGEHQHPTGLMQLIPLAEWKWEIITIDLLPNFQEQLGIMIIAWL